MDGYVPSGAERRYYDLAVRWSQADRCELLDLLLAASTPRIDFQGHLGLDRGKLFEYLVLSAFEAEFAGRGEGGVLAWPRRTSMAQIAGVEGVAAHATDLEQLDGVVHLRGMSFVLECKTGSATLGLEPVAKLRFHLQRRPPGTLGVLMHLNELSAPTRLHCRIMSPISVLLWSRAEVAAAIREGRVIDSLWAKYVAATVDGIPDYSTLALSEV